MLWKTVLLLALADQVLALENGLLRTPPMGWLAWERFRCNIDCDADPKNCISEQLFMEMADRLAEDGWRDLGCFSTPEEQAKGYPMMAAALNATGRPIAFSCSWPAYEGGLPPKVNYSLLADICNLWRNYDDIQDSWSSVLSILDWFADNQDVLQPVAGPGHWNDPDMLLIGNFGLSFEQARAQMALWTVLAAPLFMSTDLRTISAQSVDILQNPLMIKINQDPLGIQGRRILKDKSSIEVFLRPLARDAYAVVFFSRRADMPYRFRSSLAQLGFSGSGVYEAQDVYTGGIISGLQAEANFTVIINPSGVVMWYLYPTGEPEGPQL
ncbi:alpha-N-acetylgalactosaminidase [Phyllostomus discolor]|uniref:Alpha-N-acetylgalactosaminidase n=1 Tax=Phyllostomus discolor TaxID=89673 RepID=A0A834END3_9CHIR|nr:alpha-N-acetylgalactosaminidase [Phyllostomus discolor]